MTDTTTPQAVVDRVPIGKQTAATRVVAILRAENADRAEAVADVLVEAGVRSLELTLTTRGALEVLQRLVARLPDEVEVGAGTVLTAQDVDRAVDAGASYVVAPNVDREVIATALRRRVASYPGAFTPTEIAAAWRAGASAVKLFPAGTLGPGYLTAVRAPLPDIPIMPTGGVDAAAVGDWLRAGAVAVGMGGPLIGDALSPGGDLRALAERARTVVEVAAR